LDAFALFIDKSLSIMIWNTCHRKWWFSRNRVNYAIWDLVYNFFELRLEYTKITAMTKRKD